MFQFQYPVLIDGHPSNDIPLSHYFTGEYCTDHICCLEGISYKNLIETIEKYPNVTLICK